MNFYTQKLLVTGKTAELYTYSKPVYYGFQAYKKGALIIKREAKPRSDSSVKRARKNVRRITNSNPGMDKFLTLTFAKHITDVKTANYEFKKFRQRLERFFGRKFKYICVIEFMKNGRIHFHLMLDIPFIPWQDIIRIWGQGRPEIQFIRDKQKTGAYISKYISKGLDDIRLYGKKTYFYSRLVLKPLISFFKNCSIDEYLHLFYPRIKGLKSFSYFNEHRGQVMYTLLQLT